MCMFGCVCRLNSCWFCAGLVCKINSCCCCTLPAVVSRLPVCDAECLQHLPLHSTVNIKVTIIVRAHNYNQNMSVSTISSELLIFLEANFCGVTPSWAELSCEKTGLLCSRSRSQQRQKISMNVCLDVIFWTAEPFASKPAMMMIITGLSVLHADWLAVSKVTVTVRTHLINIWLFL